jgi:hypothetical protein
MLCGANHLYPSDGRWQSFPQLLSRGGFLVNSNDLLKTPGWDDSWTRDWRDPRPLGAVRYRYQCCVLSGIYKGFCDRRCDRLLMKVQNRRTQ